MERYRGKGKGEKRKNETVSWSKGERGGEVAKIEGRGPTNSHIESSSFGLNLKISRY